MDKDKLINAIGATTVTVMLIILIMVFLRYGIDPNHIYFSL